VSLQIAVIPLCRVHPYRDGVQSEPLAVLHLSIYPSSRGGGGAAGVWQPSSLSVLCLCVCVSLPARCRHPFVSRPPIPRWCPVAGKTVSSPLTKQRTKRPGAFSNSLAPRFIMPAACARHPSPVISLLGGRRHYLCASRLKLHACGLRGAGQSVGGEPAAQ